MTEAETPAWQMRKIEAARRMWSGFKGIRTYEVESLVEVGVRPPVENSGNWNNEVPSTRFVQESLAHQFPPKR